MLAAAPLGPPPDHVPIIRYVPSYHFEDVPMARATRARKAEAPEPGAAMEVDEEPVIQEVENDGSEPANMGERKRRGGVSGPVRA